MSNPNRFAGASSKGASSRRSERRESQRAIEKEISKKKTFGEIVEAMNPSVTYMFEDGPFKGKSLTGAQWKLLVAVYQKAETSRGDMPLQDYIKKVWGGGAPAEESKKEENKA